MNQTPPTGLRWRCAFCIEGLSRFSTTARSQTQLQGDMRIATKGRNRSVGAPLTPHRRGLLLYR